MLSVMERITSHRSSDFFRELPMANNLLPNRKIGGSGEFGPSRNQATSVAATINSWPFRASKWPFDDRLVAIGRFRPENGPSGAFYRNRWPWMSMKAFRISATDPRVSCPPSWMLPDDAVSLALIVALTAQAGLERMPLRAGR